MGATVASVRRARSDGASSTSSPRLAPEAEHGEPALLPAGQPRGRRDDDPQAAKLHRADRGRRRRAHRRGPARARRRRTTTLRVYAAWVSEADQRAATGLMERMPERPRSTAARGTRTSWRPPTCARGSSTAGYRSGLCCRAGRRSRRPTTSRLVPRAVLSSCSVRGTRGHSRRSACGRTRISGACRGAASRRVRRSSDGVATPAPILIDLELRRGTVGIGRWATAVESLDAPFSNDCSATRFAVPTRTT